MLRRFLRFGCAVGLSLTGAPSHADPSVTAAPGQIDNVSVSSSMGSWVISFRAIGSANSNVTVSAASNEPISSIQAETNSNSAHRVNLTVTGPSVAAVSEFGSGNGEFWVTSITTTTGNIGHVTADIIGSLDAGGDISGNITSTRTTAGISEDGIGTPSAAGSITGNITSHRRIGSIYAPVGSLGASPSVRSTVYSATTIGSIRAGDIYADITLNLTGGNGAIDFLETKPSTSGAGDFYGSLTCERIVGFSLDFGLDVKGDCHADIDHDSHVMVTPFRIGDSLVGDILLPAYGLTKQIYINANSDGGEWLGDVKLNGTAIDQDTDGVYTNIPSTIGGAAVGLSTFRFHPQGCVPLHDATVYDAYFDPSWPNEGDPPCEHAFRTVRIRHFGPVSIVDPLPSNTTAVYSVFAEFVGCGDPPCGGPYDVTDEFEFDEGVSADGVQREIVVTRKSEYDDGVWESPYEYFIVLQENEQSSGDTTLQSDVVDENPRVPTYIYHFTLLDGCGSEMDMLFDQNGDDSLTAEDLEAWPGVNPDVSADNAVTTFDLYKLMCGWAQRENLPR